MTNKEISEQFSMGNFSFCYEHFAEDIEWEIIGGDQFKGKEMVVTQCNRMLAEMDGTLNNTLVLADGDAIAIEGYCYFTDAENNAGKVSYCDVFHFENKKIKTIRSYCILHKSSAEGKKTTE